MECSLRLGAMGLFANTLSTASPPPDQFCGVLGVQGGRVRLYVPSAAMCALSVAVQLEDLKGLVT
jgi:hypothetical protein